jgi:3-phenylpropionate/trans-cinnamate dioxygenase ferredoxin reductase component
MSAGVVIAGGGLAAQRCAETLRRAGYEGRIRMICAESHRPYDRPPLSKQVLVEEDHDRTLSFRAGAWYEENAVELLLGVRASGLAPRQKLVALSDGSHINYEQLLIATGSRPRRMPMFEDYSNVASLRTIEDARALRAALRPGARLAIVGAGFIGQEVAGSARRAGVETTIIEAAPAPLVNLLGPTLSGWLAALHRSEGVDLRLGTQVASVNDHGNGSVRSLTLTDGSQIECDHMLLGVGVEPDLDWVEGSGLDRAGVRTDANGCSDIPDIFAAGDAAAGLDPILGRHVVGSHWEAAGRQGTRAAKALLGLEPGPPGMTSFWTDLFDTRIQYLGHAGLADDVSFDGDRRSRDFSATFVRNGRPVAGLLVDRPHELPAMRALLTASTEGGSA